MLLLRNIMLLSRNRIIYNVSRETFALKPIFLKNNTFYIQLKN